MSFIPEGFDRQGHRGCRGLMPENTWPAMQKALDLGVTTLEMDVVISKDKKVVVSHESWFVSAITTRADGSFIHPDEEMSLNIYRMNYEEVMTYDVGLKSHPDFPQQKKLKAYKPLLDDLIKQVESYVARERRTLPFYNIEIKSDPRGDGIYHPVPEEFAQLVMDVIRKTGTEDRVMIQAFDFRPLRYLHIKYPSLKIGMLVENEKPISESLKDLSFQPYAYNPDYNLLTEPDVRYCHQKDIKVIPWTVNDRSIMDKLMGMGVDGIITDYPDLFEHLK